MTDSKPTRRARCRSTPSWSASWPQLLDETELTEIEVEDGDRRIRVARNVTAAAAPRRIAAPRSRRAVAAPAAADAPRRPRPRTPMRVKSPMVGTAYLPPEPGATPFVAVGDTVDGRRDAADRRGDEGDEPDHRAQRRHGRRRSWSRTASRSSSTSRSSSSSRRAMADRKAPDRQSRRDRAAHPSRLP